MKLSHKHQKMATRTLFGFLRVWICLIVFTFFMSLVAYTYAKVYDEKHNLSIFLADYIFYTTHWLRYQLGEPPMSFKVTYWSFSWLSRLFYPIYILHKITAVLIEIGFGVGFIFLFLYLNGWFPYCLFTYLSRCYTRRKSLEETC
jgi:hypothetical protein